VKLPDLKQLRQVRLLPVVIFAGLALLLLKGVGIMSGGGYVLTGVEVAQAAGGGGQAEVAAATGEASMKAPAEVTMTDNSPVLEDDSPTLPLREEPADGGHGGAEADAGAGHGAPAEDAAGDGGTATEPPAAEVAAEAGHEEADAGDTLSAEAPPLVKGDDGNLVPLAIAEGTASEVQLLERLSVRRDELEQREAELEMRMALVEAAEKRIDERTSALEALEARINAMVDEKRTLEEAQFVAVVSMYETKKPKDAAAIFDQLDMPVLLRVARAVNPRKMAPIMAKMNPTKAMQLTAGLAVDQVEPTIEMAPSGTVAELPQIVGQ
jgi:flagellar motility protein MotE (MotC chaperone)